MSGVGTSTVTATGMGAGVGGKVVQVLMHLPKFDARAGLEIGGWCFFGCVMKQCEYIHGSSCNQSQTCDTATIGVVCSQV